MRRKPGDIGKFVSDFIPDRILFGNRFFREWYDSNPYRRYDGNDDDTHGKEIQKDILVSKREGSCLSDARAVIVVNGACTNTKTKRTTYQYNVTVYFDFEKYCDELSRNNPFETIELSPDGKRAIATQTIIKSNLEKNYKRFTTVKDLSEETLKVALEDAVKSYNARIDRIKLHEIILQLNQMDYAGYLF